MSSKVTRLKPNCYECPWECCYILVHEQNSAKSNRNIHVKMRINCTKHCTYTLSDIGTVHEFLVLGYVMCHKRHTLLLFTTLDGFDAQLVGNKNHTYKKNIMLVEYIPETTKT